MKSRKWTSLLLALAMVAAALLPAMVTAHAAAGVPDLMAAYSAKWNGFGNIAAANKVEKEADSLEILTAYGQLPEAARDALGVELISNLTALTYHYLRSSVGTSTATAVYIDTYISANIATPKMLRAQELAKYILGGTYGLNYSYTNTAGQAASIKFAVNTDFSNPDHRKAFDSLSAEIKAADELTRQYLALFSNSAQFSSAAPYAQATTRALLFRINSLVGTGAAREAAVLQTLKTYDALGTAMSAGLQLTANGFEALQAYEASGEALDVTKLAGLQAQTEALPRFVTVTLSSLSTTTASGYPLGSVNGKAIAPSHVKDILLIGEKIISLINAMQAYEIDQPSGADVKAMQAARDAIASTPRSYLTNSAFTARYDAILASYQSERRPARSEERPGTEGYEKARMSYAAFTGKFFSARSLGTLEPLAVLISKLAIGDIGSKLYTNETVAALAGMNSYVYDMVKAEAESVGDIEVIPGMFLNAWEVLEGAFANCGTLPTPQVLAKHLDEEEYAVLSAKFAELADWSEYDAAEFTDWGVTAGDRDSFIKAAVAALRPVFSLVYYFGEAPDVLTGDAYQDFVSDGNYEKVVLPFLEALNCRGVLSSDAFMDKALALPVMVESTKYFGKRHDALGEALLNPIFNLLEDLAADPLPLLLDLLPRLAYAEQQGDLDPLYNWQLNLTVYHASFIPFKSIQGLLNMVAAGFLPEGAALPEADWETLAHLGKLEAQTSKNGTHVYKNFVTADRADVLEFLKQYLAEILEDDTAAEPICTALAEAIGLNLTWKEARDTLMALLKGNPFKLIRSGFTIVKSLFAGGGSSGGDGDGGSGSSLSTGEIFRVVFQFLGASIRNRFVFYYHVFTGKVSVI